MTAGGNPIYKCADCAKACAAMGPSTLCWCGYSARMNHDNNPYVCLPFRLCDEYPGLGQVFRNCGWEPGRGEVGVVLKKDWHEIRHQGRERSEDNERK